MAPRPGRSALAHLTLLVLLRSRCALSSEGVAGPAAGAIGQAVEPALPATPPGCTPLLGASPMPMRVGVHDSLTEIHPRARPSLTMAVMLASGTLLICAMWAVNRHTNKKAEMWENDLRVLKDTDQYILSILRKFSSLSVDEHVFRGIKKRQDTISLEFRDLSATVPGPPGLRVPCLPQPEPKTLLKGVSGRFNAGRISAIMGPSGAGKTTLLNVLTGKAKAGYGFDVGGSTQINGQEGDLSQLRNVVGFVPQDDIVHEKLTVRENIFFSAALRNERGTSKKHLLRVTNDVLQVLQLEPQQSKLVGNRATGQGLSGGQRKRVNVGTELAACPSLLFLDEPTSGLDATSSLLLVRQLQKMTQLGMTIVMVVHQPRYGLFTLIDDVLLLGKGGQTVFSGPTARVAPYLQSLGFTLPPNENPADWLMDVISGQAGIPNPRIATEELHELWSGNQLTFGRGISEDAESSGMTPSRRRLTAAEDWDVVRSHVKDAWASHDQPMTSQLARDDFRQVLINCTGQEPDPIVLQELIDRVTQPPGSCITYQQFIRYLRNFHGSISRSMYGAPTAPDVRAFWDTPNGHSLSDLTDIETSEDSEDEEKQGGAVAPGASLHRTLPGAWGQFAIICRRRMRQWWRRMPIRVLFLIVVEFAAAFLGVMDHFAFHTAPYEPPAIVNAQISLGLLTSVYCLNTFSEDPPIFWREASHGLNRWSFFWGRHMVDLIDVLLMCLGFTTMYMCIVNPLLSYPLYVWPYFLVVWVAAGWGYLISAVLPFEYLALGPFISALTSFVTGGILGLPQHMSVYLDGGFYETVVSVLSFTRWSTPMIFFKYTELFPVNLEDMSLRAKFEYQLYDDSYRQSTWHFHGDDTLWWTGTLVLLAQGLVLRMGACLGLQFVNRGKQV